MNMEGYGYRFKRISFDSIPIIQNQELAPLVTSL